MGVVRGQWEEWQDRPNAETFHLKPVESYDSLGTGCLFQKGACSLSLSLCLSVCVSKNLYALVGCQVASYKL
jgi:hypothetical protein